MTPLRRRNELLETFERDGRVWFREAISPANLMVMDNLCDLNGKPGQRLAFNTLSRRAFGPQSDIGRLVSLLSPGSFPVRLVAFDKNSESNWSLPWHQDRVIAVRNRTSAPGFSNWSNKSGQWHCEPPADVLAGMLFARVHLDDADKSNGAMEIALGSHRYGLVRSADAANIAAKCPVEIGQARRGDVLVLKMLTLHRSPAAETAAARRAYRLDYAAAGLPAPLAWAS